ncbi:MAG: SPOR domain-containing protein [Bacteroidales bacterium]|jgi:cell division septation protein DedD|nr:SPOR domain-containing protein [Bacteroidales bacterium]
MDINHCISELLTVHDCVIIPGFGGFIGNYSPAQIDPIHHSFRPPSKKLLFNINLKQNDGLLATCVSASCGTSYDDACLMIDTFVQSCKAILKSGKSFIIPDVGRLYSGREGNIQFEQDKNSNLLPDAFGLTLIISPPVTRNYRPMKSGRSLEAHHDTRPERRWITTKSLRWAAILALPIGIAAIVGVTQYDKLKTSTTNDAGIFSSVLSRFSSTSLVDKKEAPAKPTKTLPHYNAIPSVFNQEIVTNKNTISVIDESNNQAYNDIPIFKAIPESAKFKLKETRGPASDTEAKSHSDDNFAVIIGAFRLKENAENLISQLKQKGTDALIFDRSRTGLYRVTIGAFSERKEALQLLSSAKSGDFSGAWLLAK